MSDRFNICHTITAHWEGGWSNHPADPGGATMYGVTQAVFTAWLKRGGKAHRSVRTITKSEALAIYREEYWLASGADKLFPGVDLAVYDGSVNSGVSRGKKWLKAAIGSNDHSVTVKKICRARLSFVQALSTWKSFGKGWGRRIADIEVRGVQMALMAMGLADAEISRRVEIEKHAAEAETKAADRAATSTGGGAVASGGAVTVDPAGMDTATLWVLGLVCLGCLAAVVIAIARRRVAANRAQAYAEVLA